MADIDFRVQMLGRVWNVRAVSPEALAFVQDQFDTENWKGLTENFNADQHVARDLVARLMKEGWRVSI